MAAGQQLEINQLPRLKVDAIAALNVITPAPLQLLIENWRRDQRRIQETLDIDLLAVNSAPLAALDPASGTWVDQTAFLAAFVTPDDPEIGAFLQEARRYLEPGHAFDGYQGIAEKQVRALYRALQDRGMLYANSVLDFNPATAWEKSQRVRLPGQVLASRSANCIDGVLLFASLLEHLHLAPGRLTLDSA